MKQPSGIFKVTYSLGELLLTFIKLQFLWLIFTFLGGIIFGIFPATATVIQYFHLLFEKKETPTSFFDWFKMNFKTNFKAVNLLCFSAFFCLLFLWIDLRIVDTFLQNNFLHFFILVLFIFALIISMYLIPAFLRYQMSYKLYFVQSFYLALCSFAETLAILVGLILTIAIATFFPILIIIAYIPLLCLPLSWFTYQAMIKMEKKNDMIE